MRRVLFVLILAVLTAAAGAAASRDWPDPFAMEFPEIEVTPVEPHRVELDNGLVVYLLEDRSLPLVEGTAYIRAGRNYDPDEKLGLAQLTARMAREGGAGGLTAEEIDQQLEYLAASVELSADDPLAAASFSSLSHNLDEVLEVFAAVLIEPHFAEERFAVEQGRQLEAIRRQNDQPVQVAVREYFAKVAEGHPSGRYPTIETVQSLSAADLAGFHGEFFRPNETVLAVSGDFDADDMAERIADVFSSWERGEAALPELPEYNVHPDPVVFHAQKDIAQSIILLGHPAVTFDDPDYIRLDVLNRILGGAGDNRLFTEIRTRRGLAYAVGSQVTQGFEYPGVFYAYSISRVDKTGEVIDLMLNEIRRVVDEPVSDDELSRNRRAILNGAVFRYASPHAVASRAALVDFLNVDPDYYEKQMEVVQHITREELLETAKAHLRPDETVIMVVGNKELFDRPLDEFGLVEEIDLDI